MSCGDKISTPIPTYSNFIMRTLGVDIQLTVWYEPSVFRWSSPGIRPLRISAKLLLLMDTCPLPITALIDIFGSRDGSSILNHVNLIIPSILAGNLFTKFWVAILHIRTSSQTLALSIWWPSWVARFTIRGVVAMDVSAITGPRVDQIVIYYKGDEIRHGIYQVIYWRIFVSE